MDRISLKTIGILFLVLLTGLVITHFLIVRNVRAELTARGDALGTQVVSLQKQVGELTAENLTLETRLGIEGLRNEVLRSNFGTAGELVDEFNAMLAENGCTKLDKLYPVFEELKAALEENRQATALVGLERISNIIFEE